MARSRNEVLAAGGGMIVSAAGVERRLAGMLANAEGADVAEGREVGCIERSLAGVVVLERSGTFVVPLVMRVNSARRPLLS